ncbi:acyl transferase [Pseudonocardia kunmingensis]|uniref:Uncharacterized protein n=1 Tax=Pseudonocardia kunmingensis TaxID=630975 RepID=A0A543DY77_9PSEU|nr:acyl transferase [Pseudonocardia kunmingensis]TQM14209.1 hypothetical protein FB558_0969 [Pseudonocardia kunmingensis]
MTTPARHAGAAPLLGGLLLGGLLLVGCTAEPPTSGVPAGAELAPRAAAPGATPPAPSPGQEASVEPVELPWPAAGAAEAAALQTEVDRGSQPWLLDPSEVAIAYAAAAHGWPDAEAYPGPDGTSVDVRNAAGDRISLSLAQPARTGDDGIWVVTAEHRGGR